MKAKRFRNAGGWRVAWYAAFAILCTRGSSAPASADDLASPVPLAHAEGETVPEIHKLRDAASALKAALRSQSVADDLEGADQDKVEYELKRLRDHARKLKSDIETAAGSKQGEVDQEQDPKKKSKLQTELERINQYISLVEDRLARLDNAIEHIDTLTKAVAEDTIKLLDETRRTGEKIVETITGAAKDIIKIVLDDLKGLLKPVVEPLKGILDGLGDLFKFLFGILRGFLGIFGLASATDLSTDGTHSIALQGPASVTLTVTASGRPQQVQVPITDLTFDVVSSPGPTSNLRILTVNSATFAGHLGSFAVEDLTVGVSQLTLAQEVTWSAVFDSQDQTLHLPLAGAIVNNYTPAAAPMAFSVVASGSMSNLSMVGATMEPCEICAVPALSQWGLLVFALVTLTAGTIVLRRRVSAHA